MTSLTSQVRSPLFHLLKNLLEPKGPLFPKVAGAKRDYPGEPEGAYLASHLNGLSRVQRKRFWLPALDAMQQLEMIPKRLASLRSWNLDDLEDLEREINRQLDLYFGKAFITQAKLKRKIDRRGPAKLTNEGLVIPPDSAEGKAALAALLLERDRRLLRLRHCLNCSDWFYARFERQLFCSNPQKNCQWNHYHSPQWRKKHREQNRKHQRAYRQRTFKRR